MQTRMLWILGLIGCSGGLQERLDEVARGSDGRLGVCAQAVGAEKMSCVRGDERFSLQSVMKLVVGMVVLSEVDAGRMKLSDAVVVTRADRSLGMQPIMDLVGDGGYVTTVGDLVERAIVESDSAAVDVLLDKLVGVKTVQDWLARQNLDVRIDRSEKELQAETSGLTWRAEYVDEAVFDADEAKVTVAAKQAAFAAYLKDPRDTATPRAMTQLLARLVDGKLLSAESTAWLLAVMEKTKTFPDRLKGGVPSGWRVGHKTGTSGSVDGVTGTANDVGFLIGPDGRRIVIAVFLAESRKDGEAQNAVIAAAARATAK